MLPCCHVIMLPCYHVTLLPCYAVTLLPNYHITLSLCYHVIMSPFYHVTLLSCYHFIMLSCYPVTLLPYLVTYLSSLGPRGLLRPARRFRYPSRSAAEETAASHDCQASWFLSFSTVRLHVFLGRPRFLLPSGAHVSAVFEMLSGLFLKMWPIQRHLLTCMRVDTCMLPDASYSSSLLRW